MLEGSSDYDYETGKITYRDDDEYFRDQINLSNAWREASRKNYNSFLYFRVETNVLKFSSLYHESALVDIIEKITLLNTNPTPTDRATLLESKTTDSKTDWQLYSHGDIKNELGNVILAREDYPLTMELIEAQINRIKMFIP